MRECVRVRAPSSRVLRTLRVSKPSLLVRLLLGDQYLRLDLVVSEAEVLEVGSSVGLD